jgi:hypothetical protein
MLESRPRLVVVASSRHVFRRFVGRQMAAGSHHYVFEDWCSVQAAITKEFGGEHEE